jgi:hypothetical protein
VLVADSINTIIKNNLISSAPSVTAINSKGCAWSVYSDNELVWNHRFVDNSLDAAQAIISYDAFPVIRNNGLIKTQSGGGGIRTLPWLLGSQGYIPIGNGKAKTLMYFGRPTSPDEPSARPFHWEDGDEVGLYDAVSTVFYHFVFMTSISDSTTQFNDYASLVSLINAHSGGSWTATNPVLDFFGSDSQAYGYIQIEANATGTERNGDIIDINQDEGGRSGPRTCGVYLRPWSLDGFYASKTQAQFDGGSADKTRTVVYTPLASPDIPLIVSGIDADSHALDPVSYRADTVPGLFYVITHAPSVTGDEKFFWKVG